MKNSGGWCRFSPCENFKMCVKTRPPLVIFTIGIFVLALAFIALAIYIQETDNVPNPNFVTDWDGFLMDMSRFEWSDMCSEQEESMSEEIKGNATEEVSVVVPMKLSNFPTKPGSIYRTNIKGKDLISDNLPKSMDEDVLVLTFSSFNVSHGNAASVCMTVLSNETFLSPQLKKPTLLCSPPKADDFPVIYVKACKKAADKSPAFSVEHNPDPLLRMYLTVDDRLNIHMHLMSTSYFLFVIALTVLLYGLLKRRVYSVSESHNSLLHNGSTSTV